MGQSISFWIGFNIFVLLMLALDLGVFHRKAHKVGFKESLAWLAVWVILALVFALGTYVWFGKEPSLQFLTGFLIEKALSVDNIFVILLIFTYFKVPDAYQHRVLFWGILGAIVMRGAFIVGGVALIQKYHWIVIVFGVFLIVSGIKMAFSKKEIENLDNNIILRFVSRIIPMTKAYDGSRFIIRNNGKIMATPLFGALVMVEASDLVFAVDSIPAILAISSDPFIVYTSNVFAILGLRSLYFAVSGLVDLFHFLKFGLSAILVFVGCKMLLAGTFKVPTLWALGVIVSILCCSILASVLWPAKQHGHPASEGMKGVIH